MSAMRFNTTRPKNPTSQHNFGRAFDVQAARPDEVQRCVLRPGGVRLPVSVLRRRSCLKGLLQRSGGSRRGE